jgi:hypothetical protein
MTAMTAMTDVSAASTGVLNEALATVFAPGVRELDLSMPAAHAATTCALL